MKKSAKKRAMKKVVRKRAPKRASRVRAPRKTARRSAGKKSARKKPARKKTARKKVAKKSRRPKLAVVTPPAPPAPPAPTAPAAPAATESTSFPQRDGASAKQLLIFELVRARTVFTAAIQGMLASVAEQPFAPGKWSARETVLHLISRDRIRLRELEAVLRGSQPSWRGITDIEQATVNEEDLAALRHHAWDDAVRLLHTTRVELMDSLASIPEEPAEVWTTEHPFGWMMLRLPPHDRHHADAIKTWRTQSGA